MVSSQQPHCQSRVCAPRDAADLHHRSRDNDASSTLAPFVAAIFGALCQVLSGDTKRKEALAYLRTVSDFDYRT